jgi:peptidoglycan/LPS O-acetylase OafA/YrhL
VTVPAPTTVRRAAALVMLEGAVGVIGAGVFVVRGIAGADQHIVSGFGNAVWFAIIGGAVLAAGLGLWHGRRWGRGVAVFAQLLLLPVTWYVAVGSHQWFYGIPIAAVAVAVLVLLFSPSAVAWWTGQDSARADNSGPDTR